MLTFEDLRPSLSSLLRHRRWVLGYSGGLDSSCLLQLLDDFLKSHNDAAPQLLAVHVDHGLHSASADWRRFCQAQCRSRGVELLVREVRVAVDGHGVEEAARRARYAAFAECLREGDLLFLAHHRDDQMETFLLRLCRGAGPAGMAAMPRRRALPPAELARPLLDVDRSRLLAHARAQGLSWIEDASNADCDIDRNYLRHRVLPLIEARWPGWRGAWQRAIDLSDEARELNDALALADLRDAGQPPWRPQLPLSALSHGAARTRNTLRYWLRQLDLPPPPPAAWDNFLPQLAVRGDAQPQLRWKGGELRRWRGALHAMTPLPLPEAGRRWEASARLAIDGMGTLHAQPTLGGGLRAAPGDWRVMFRQGGERCRPVGAARHRTLKNLLQERGVPPWLRERVPLLYLDGDLAAVGDLWVCEGFSAAAGESAWRLHWRRPQC